MKQTRLYQNIINKVQEDIKNAILPPECEFAQQLDVSCTSVCKAIIALEVFGIIEVKLRSDIYILK